MTLSPPSHISPVPLEDTGALTSSPVEDGAGLLADELHRFWDIIRKRRWIVALFTVAAVAGTLAYTVRQPKIYRATAALVIDQSAPQVLSGIKDVVELGDRSYWGSRSYFKTQYEILRSRRLAQVVVDRLDLGNNLHFLGIDTDKMTTEEVDEALALADPAQILISRLEVEPLRDSYIVYLHIEDTNPDFAAEIATTLAATYRDQNLALRRKVLQGAQGDLERLVSRLSKDKVGAEEALLKYERAHQVGTLESRKKTIDLRLEALTTRLGDARSRLAEVAARSAEMRTIAGEEDIFAISYPTILSSPTIQVLKEQALELRSAIAQAKVQYLDQHPTVVELTARLQNVYELARKEVKNQTGAVEHEKREISRFERKLQAQVTALETEGLDLAARELEYGWLKQRSEEAKSVYDMVARRLLETQLSEEVETNNVWLLEEALPPQMPIRPRLRLNLAIGAFLGLIGGIAFAFLFELADTSVSSDRDIEHLLRVPALGIVPVVDERRDADAPQVKPTADELSEGTSRLPNDPALLVYRRPKGHVAEFCRSIRTNLMFMRPDDPLRTLLITSPNPREGKTTVSVSVATTMALSGSSVVIVDTDMRRPRLHKVFGLPNNKGISSALIGAEPAHLMAQETGVPGLHLLACGPIPPNPSELLHARRFREIKEELKAHYDYVIFDSPPVLAVTDSLIVGKHVDGVMMIVRVGSTSKGAVVSAKRRMDAIGVTLLGCVLNQVDTERKDYRYYYYYGGRYYGRYYHYGEDEGEDAANEA